MPAHSLITQQPGFDVTPTGDHLADIVADDNTESGAQWTILCQVTPKNVLVSWLGIDKEKPGCNKI